MAQKKKRIKKSDHVISGIDLVDLNVLGFTIPYSLESPHYPDEVKEFKFGVHTNILFRTDYHFKVVLQIDSKLIFESENNNSDLHDELETSLSAEFIFKVLIDSEGDEVGFIMDNLPESFRQIAVSISYSTMRGILYARAAGTVLEGAILPLVSPQNLLTSVEHEEAVE